MATASVTQARVLMSQELAQAWRSDDACYTRAYCEENVYRLLSCAAAASEVATSPPRCLHAFCASFGADVVGLQHGVAASSTAVEPSTASAFSVFITSRTKAVAMWHQLACPAASDAIFWDYHVIPMCTLAPAAGAAEFVLHGRSYASETLFVFDLDSRLPFPSPCAEYLQQSFQSHASAGVPPDYAPLFRVVPAADFLRCFSSDRRHMRKPLKAGGDAAATADEWLAPPPVWPCIRGPAAPSDHCLDALCDVSTIGRDPQVMNLKAMMRFAQAARVDTTSGPDASLRAAMAAAGVHSAVTSAAVRTSDKHARRTLNALLDP